VLKITTGQLYDRLELNGQVSDTRRLQDSRTKRSYRATLG